MRTILDIDRDLDALHASVQRRHRVSPFSAASWQRAWDADPKAYERRQILYGERAVYQVKRDIENAHALKQKRIVVRLPQATASLTFLRTEPALWQWHPKAEGVLDSVRSGSISLQDDSHLWAWDVYDGHHWTRGRDYRGAAEAAHDCAAQLRRSGLA